MAYVKSGAASDIPIETVAAMAQLVGLAIPPEDIGGLANAIRDQFESIVPLESLDLTDVMPAIEFDPRWRNDDDAAR
ncbi:MAG: hypothetical protein U0031_10810 [Thermomicrobiales bacterium]